MNMFGKLNMTKEEVILEKIKRASVVKFSKELIDGIDLDLDSDFMVDMYAFKAIEELLALKAGDRVIRHPENWKEAVKERWFPRWLKKRTPVKYKEYDVLVVFPDLLRKHPVPGILRGYNYYLTYAEHGFLPSDKEE